MKKILISLALALSAAASFAVAASPMCNITNVESSFACSGPFSGNEVGNAATLLSTGIKFTELNNGGTPFDPGFDDPFKLVDVTSSDSGSQLALIFGTGGKTGTLILKDTAGYLNNLIFGIALKASNSYSLYLFDGAAMSAPGGIMNNLSAGFTKLDFTTFGTAWNSKGNAQGLSHASLWAGPASKFFGDGPCTLSGDCPVGQVPEPGTWALFAAGLGALAFITSRRRKVLVAKV